MFDEMYLQKCEEYSGGEIIGAGENNELFKRLLSFMIVGLKENVPYVIKSVLEVKINGKLIKEQISDSLKILKDCGFRVRAIVSDNHSANVLAYKLLLEESDQSADYLFIEYDHQKIYLLHDVVHLIGYDFILTAHFQSDPLERRFGQYRQIMSGGRFLGGLKETISGKIIKIKSLLKEGIDIDEEVKVTGTGEMEIMKKEIDSLGISLDMHAFAR